jgi:hypothetical protein
MVQGSPQASALRRWFGWYRHARPAYAGLPLLAASWLGCPAPDLPTGRFACEVDSDCPSSMRCVAGRCGGDAGAAEPSVDPVLAKVDAAAGDPPDAGSATDGDKPAPDAAVLPDPTADDGGIPVDASEGPTPCTAASDCFDFDSCTDDICVDGVCTWPPVSDCCTANDDCIDGALCTSDYCDLATHRCRHDAKSGCCARDEDCPSSACNLGRCDAKEHACFYESVAKCCRAAADCDDQIVCTADACSPDGACTHTPIPGCCRDQEDCVDGDACTIESCNVATGACTRQKRVCDDLDPCTDNSCDPEQGCQYRAKVCAGCCVGGQCYGASESVCTGACSLNCTSCCDVNGVCRAYKLCALTTTDPVPTGLESL